MQTSPFIHGVNEVKKAINFVCPRCGGGVPTDERRGEYEGALSRIADLEICSNCGDDEAMRDFFGQPPIGLGDWFSVKGKKK